MKKQIIFILLCVQVSLSVEFTKSIKAVFDNKKNLMWQDDEEVFLQDELVMAQVYCDELILNSYNDWYLPSIKQLQTITDITNPKGSIRKEFQYFKEEKYWSNTPFAKDKNQYWYVDFKTGKSMYHSKDEKNFIRCVRDNNE